MSRSADGRRATNVPAHASPRPPLRSRPSSPARRALLALALVLVATGALAGARAGWLALKATLARPLLERAWRETRASGAPVRPWPWADILPVARLEVPALGIALVVLAEPSGEAMAFGPALLAGDPVRAARAPLALGGHRDSHLAFLERLAPGTRIELEDRAGVRHAYRLEHARVLDSRDGPVAMPSRVLRLLLVTCYPFHAAQTGGPLRLVASATPLGSAEAARDRAGGSPDPP